MKGLEPDERIANLLVGYYALYQAVHVLVNARGLHILMTGGVLDFPVAPPPGGWSPDVVNICVAIGFAALFGAAVALLFAYGYFTGARWRIWAGTVALTITMYAHFVYAYWPIASGAWAGPNAGPYLFVHVATLPILALVALVARWALCGRLVEVAQPSSAT